MNTFRDAFLASTAATAHVTGASYEDAVDIWDARRGHYFDDVDGFVDPEYLSPSECDERAGYHYPQN